MAGVALIVGAGPRLGAAVARLCAADGMAVALATRGALKWDGAAVGARHYRCDATKRDDVERLFTEASRDLGVPDLVLFNPAMRVVGPIQDIAPENAMRPMAVLNGAFLLAQQAAKAMLARGSGTILFTGSNASVSAPALQGPVAMYKFGIRGLAQSLARELHPKNIHVGHVYPLGSIAELDTPNTDDANALAEEIATAFLFLHKQQRSAWAWELGVAPWTAGLALADR
jgi:NAD(P)-dependent dehydrogenase (short-subunit alcohol dehydrogenase family)